MKCVYEYRSWSYNKRCTNSLKIFTPRYLKQNPSSTMSYNSSIKIHVPWV